MVQPMSTQSMPIMYIKAVKGVVSKSCLQNQWSLSSHTMSPHFMNEPLRNGRVEIFFLFALHSLCVLVTEQDAVLLQRGPHNAAVNFGMYWSLQRHRVVFPAIATFKLNNSINHIKIMEVAYWPAMTLGGAAQVAAAHCPNERTLDPAVCSYNWPTYATASRTMAFTLQCSPATTHYF